MNSSSLLQDASAIHSDCTKLCKEAAHTKVTEPNFAISIRQDGTRHAESCESSGWIWFAARQLEAFLCTRFPSFDGMRILELGSGTGWLALRLALRGAHITATDQAGAIPLLLRNILSNQERFLEASGLDLNIDVHELRWDSRTKIASQEEAPFDLVVASDIIYLSEYYLPILESVRRHGPKECIISYEERKPEEETEFENLARKLGFVVTRFAGEVNPATQNQVWILLLSILSSN